MLTLQMGNQQCFKIYASNGAVVALDFFWRVQLLRSSARFGVVDVIWLCKVHSQAMWR